MALDRLQQLRDDIDAASEQTDNTVLRRGWRDTVDDYDIALRVRSALGRASRGSSLSRPRSPPGSTVTGFRTRVTAATSFLGLRLLAHA